MMTKQFLKFTVYVFCLVLVTFFISPFISCAMEKPGEFPNRPVTIVIPFGAGGGADQCSRAIAIPLQKIMGVPITLVNKPGGGGVAGFADFYAAPPDGYTICFHADFTATLYAAEVIKENPTVDWFPINIAQITFNQIYVRPDDDRFSSWDAFLSYAKESPGKIAIANVARRTGMEGVSMYLLQRELGFKVKQIAYDKPAERYGALVGGHVDALFEQPGDVVAYLESGDMKPLLTFLKERPKAFSDTPCLTDIGAKMDPLFRYRGFFLRKGTPEDRVKYLEWAFRKAWESDYFQKFNRSKYMHLVDSYRNIEEGKKLILDAIDIYKAIYKELGFVKK